MKKSKLVSCIWVLVTLLITSVGCQQYKGQYTFWRQDSSNIEKIEICSYDWKNLTRTTYAELSESEAEEIVETISELECFEYFPGDHPREYGPIQVCIIYSDGEIEIIGFTNIGYISSNGVKHLTSYSIENPKELYDIICEYVALELLPDISEEYPGWFETTEES